MILLPEKNTILLIQLKGKIVTVEIMCSSSLNSVTSFNISLFHHNIDKKYQSQQTMTKKIGHYPRMWFHSMSFCLKVEFSRINGTKWGLTVKGNHTVWGVGKIHTSQKQMVPKIQLYYHLQYPSQKLDRNGNHRLTPSYLLSGGLRLDVEAGCGVLVTCPHSLMPKYLLYQSILTLLVDSWGFPIVPVRETFSPWYSVTCSRIARITHKAHMSRHSPSNTPMHMCSLF